MRSRQPDHHGGSRNDPLINRDINAAPEPSTTTLRLTYAAFGVLALFCLFPLFRGDIASFFFGLISVAACFALAWRVLNLVVRRRVGGNHISHNSALSYVACGIVPASVIIGAVSAISVLILGGALYLFINMTQPKWLSDIIAAGTSLSGHGELFVNGEPVFAPGERPGHVLRAIRNSSMITTAARFAVSHLSTRAHVIPTSIKQVQSAFTFQFADGTNAAPLLVDFFMALSRIPVFLVLLVLLVNAYFFGAYIPQRTNQFVVERYALPRENSTMRSVTASSMGFALGLILTMIAPTGCAWVAVGARDDEMGSWKIT